MSSKFDSFAQGPGLDFVQSPCLERMDFVAPYYITMSDVLLPHPTWDVSPADFGWDDSYFVVEQGYPSSGGSNTSNDVEIAVPPGIYKLRFYVKGFAEMIDEELEAKDRKSGFLVGFIAVNRYEPHEGIFWPDFALNRVIGIAQPDTVVKIERFVDIWVRSNPGGGFPKWFLSAQPASDRQITSQGQTFPDYPRKFVGGLNRPFGRVNKNSGGCLNIQFDWQFDIALVQRLHVGLAGIYPDTELRPMEITDFVPPSACPPTF